MQRHRYLTAMIICVLVVGLALPVLGRQRGYRLDRVDYCDVEARLNSAYDTNGEKYGWASTNTGTFCRGAEALIAWTRGGYFYTDDDQDYDPYALSYNVTASTNLTFYYDELYYSYHLVRSNIGNDLDFYLQCWCTDA